MDHEKHKLHVKEQFRKIKIRQIIGFTLVISCMVYIHFTQELDINRLLILLGVGLFFSSQNWRCPVCKEYLSHFQFDLRKCSNCGTELK